PAGAAVHAASSRALIRNRMVFMVAAAPSKDLATRARRAIPRGCGARVPATRAAGEAQAATLCYIPSTIRGEDSARDESIDGYFAFVASGFAGACAAGAGARSDCAADSRGRRESGSRRQQ